MTEHHAGLFPAWLAPIQVVVLNITDKQADYAREITESLKKLGFRVKSDLRNEKIGFKIREHTLQRVPYLLVIGDREMTDRMLAVRERSGKDLGSMPLDAFVGYLNAAIANHGLTVLED